MKYLYLIPRDRPTLVFNSPFYTSHNSTLFTQMLLNTSRQQISNDRHNSEEHKAEYLVSDNIRAVYAKMVWCYKVHTFWNLNVSKQALCCARADVLSLRVLKVQLCKVTDNSMQRRKKKKAISRNIQWQRRCITETSIPFLRRRRSRHANNK